MSVVKVCDNLNNGLPACLAAGFYFDEEPDVKKWLNGGADEVPVRCSHCVISDVIQPKAKNGCFFADDKCLYSNVKGFDACFSCLRWQMLSYN